MDLFLSIIIVIFMGVGALATFALANISSKCSRWEEEYEREQLKKNENNDNDIDF